MVLPDAFEFPGLVVCDGGRVGRAVGIGFRDAREFFAVFFEPGVDFFYIVGDGEREFLAGRRVGYEDDH